METYGRSRNEVVHGAATTRQGHVLLTGAPGIGKSTVCKKLISIMEKYRYTLDGFVTEEVRLPGKGRIGFDIVPVKTPEQRAPLARKMQLLKPEQLTKFRVGNYNVFLDSFENVALPILEKDTELLLIDEIGKMELLSETFEKKVDSAFFGATGRSCIVATISRSPMLEKLRADRRCRIFEVSYQNRDNLPQEIVKVLLEILKKN